jgi:hypothetical protein
MVACLGLTSLPPKIISFGGVQPAFPTCKTSKLNKNYSFVKLVSFFD